MSNENKKEEELTWWSEAKENIIEFLKETKEYEGVHVLTLMIASSFILAMLCLAVILLLIKWSFPYSLGVVLIFIIAFIIAIKL